MVRLQLGAALLAASSARAFSDPQTIPGAYIFEFDEQQDSASFISSVKDYGNVRMNLDYKLFKGVSVQLDDVEHAEDTVRLLSESKLVKSTWPVSLYSLPETEIHWAGNETASFQKPRIPKNETSSPFSPHVMTQVDKLHERGYTGKGANIAVIDTGIDYNHPALGGCFGSDDCLVVQGYDFVGDDYNGRNEPEPDDDPMDCEGHGTHLAGTIAAQENALGFLGAAPGAKLSAYRVFGCYGSTSDEILLAAFNQAFEDGVNIVSLSLGKTVGWSEHPWSVVVSRMVDAGVPCIVANGNDGASGVFAASSPADGKGVTGIAAVENVKTPNFMQLSSYTVGDKKIDYLYTTNYNTPEKVSLELYSPSVNAEAVSEGCDPLPEDTPDLSERIVLMRAGGCDFSVKANNAHAKGALAFIVYKDGPGLPQEPGSMPWDFNAGFTVTQDQGEEWVALLKEGKTITVNTPDPNEQVSSLVEFDNQDTGGSVTFFSTWGPTWELDIKPQFGTPGGHILSTFPVQRGGYSVASGTSMAAPLAAAIFALVGEVRGTLEPKFLERLLSASAKPQYFADEHKTHNFLSPVAQQGAGTIQAYDAAFATTLIEPASLAFNDTDFLQESLSVKITNEADDSVTYHLSNIPARTVMTMNTAGDKVDPFPNEMVEDSAELDFSSSEVTLAKGESITIDVSPTPPDVDGKRLGLWSGWVAINGTDGSSFSIPYQGLQGSLYNAPVIKEEGGSWISRFDIPHRDPMPANTTWNLPAQGNPDWNNDGMNVPLLVADYTLGARVARAELVPLDSEESIGGHTYFPTWFNQRGRNTIDWNGMLDTGKYAPPGTYRFRIKALKLRGSEDKEEDWDVSWTQVFTIKYQSGSETS